MTSLVSQTPPLFETVLLRLQGYFEDEAEKKQ